MKSTQLLSVVFSLIMFTGVTAGSAAYADDDLEDIDDDDEEELDDDDDNDDEVEDKTEEQNFDVRNEGD